MKFYYTPNAAIEISGARIFRGVVHRPTPPYPGVSNS
jgi:hypothetical protein